MEKIAAFTDTAGNPANFYACACIKVYAFENGEVKMEREEVYEKIQPDSVKNIKEKTAELVDKVKDCSIVCFGEIGGVPYSVLNAKSLFIFTITDTEQGTLKSIVDDVEKWKEEQSRGAEYKWEKPVETKSPGAYFFDLIKAQEENPELSSKKALLHFLNETPFIELKIRCAHVPPWIERDGRFSIDFWEKDNQVDALIMKKQC